MPQESTVTVDDHLKQIPAATRPIVESALAVVRSAAPAAEEVVYQSSRPRSGGFMWKLVHYRSGDGYVVGIGTFTKHAALFFYRGRELADPGRLLQGSGKDTRFVALREPADAEAEAVQQLVREAFALAERG